MNTLSDTDEGKARPSVWPVYVTSGIIGIIGAALLCASFIGVPTTHPEEPWGLVFALVCMGLMGAFGLVIAVGTSLLRPWAWPVATVWGYLFGLSALGFLVFHARDSLRTSDKFFLELGEVLGNTPVPLVLSAFIVWSLSTRRRLFFPPKPDGEE